MRNLYILAYDITDDRRRTKVHRTLAGFGTALQYSVFRCHLTPIERLRLADRLAELLRPEQDRLLIADLGPETGRADEKLEIWGQPLEMPLTASDAFII